MEDDERLERWIDWPDLLGSRTGPVSGGFMANAWVRLTHPDYDELRRMMNAIGETVKVCARPERPSRCNERARPDRSAEAGAAVR